MENIFIFQIYCTPLIFVPRAEEIRKGIGAYDWLLVVGVLLRDHSIENENQRNCIMSILDANGFKWQDRISTWKVGGEGMEERNGEKIE